MATETVKFKGKSGREYTYYIHPKGTSFYDKPGNYCCGKLSNGTIRPLYFGETGSLKQRWNDAAHECAPCVERNGWNVTCAHISSAEAQDRLDEETDLRAAYDPPCNMQ